MHDGASGEHTDMDRGRGNGHAPWLPRALRPGADGVGATASVRSCFRLSRQTWRHREGALVRRRRPMPVGQAAGTGPVRMAAGKQRNRLAHSCAALDAA